MLLNKGFLGNVVEIKEIMRQQKYINNNLFVLKWLETFGKMIQWIMTPLLEFLNWIVYLTPNSFWESF